MATRSVTPAICALRCAVTTSASGLFSSATAASTYRPRKSWLTSSDTPGLAYAEPQTAFVFDLDPYLEDLVAADRLGVDALTQPFEVEFGIAEDTRVVAACSQRVLLVAREDEVRSNRLVPAMSELCAAVATDDGVQEKSVVAGDNTLDGVRPVQTLRSPVCTLQPTTGRRPRWRRGRPRVLAASGFWTDSGVTSCRASR